MTEGARLDRVSFAESVTAGRFKVKACHSLLDGLMIASVLDLLAVEDVR